MTREIIERHLLISGSATRPEVRALERSAKKFGFSVGRTGQFGIGVLSYFMIADRVEILTRRSTEAGDRDGSGWKFVTEGIGEFGQLERIDRSTNGTEIKLRLREDLARKVGNWETAISEYCKQTLVFSPCIVEFAGKISGQQWKVGPGWTWNPEVAADIDAALERTHSEADTPDDPYETALTKEKRRSLAQSWRNLEERAAKQLRWAGPEPVSIGRFGQGRAWVPYFEIDGDASLIYVNNEGGHIHKLPDNSDFLRYRVRARHSWKGFTTQIDDDRYGLYDVRFGLVFLETNLTEGLDPSISRESAIGMDTEELMNALDRARQQALSAFFGKFSRSRFNAINFAISRHDRNLSAMDAHWIQSHSGAESGKLLPLDAPCVDLPYWDNPQLRERACFWRDGRIRILKRLVGKSHLGQPIRACTLQDGGLALVRLDKFHVMPVWFWDGKGVVPTGHNYCERFPPTWSNLITVTIDSMVFYNRDHEWVKMVARKGELPTLRSAKAYADALESAIQSKEDAIQFLFQLVASGPSDLYTVIKENHPGDLGEVVHLAGIGDEMTLYGWNTSPGRDPSRENRTWVFNKSGFGMKEASKLQDGLQFSDGMTFQFPDDAWWIKMVPQREAAAQS
jgi:hypothetical protein